MDAFRGLCLLWFFVHLVGAQTHPSTVPVPPLQWIRLKPTNVGPALVHAVGGFDPINNQLIVFGGETSGGLIDANTHLLDMSTMTWTSPSPTINKNIKPPGRSRALSGHDLIASYRNGLLVYGGLGQEGPLSDVWEYNFSGQFWYNITTIEGDIPSARYGATGGGDPPSASNADPNLLTTFWLTGGVESSSDGSTRLVPYDDIYRLRMSGTIAGNFQNPKATWEKATSASTGNTKPRIGQAGLVQRTLEGEAKLGFYGGCVSTTNATVSCAQQDAHIIANTAGGQWNDIAACPSARIGAAFVPNLNHLFNDMAFLLFGLSPNTNQGDVSELGSRGEIDVLSISQGIWSRVLPSCDPQSDPPCPIPREGAVVVSSANTVAGSNGSTAASAASDIVIFGGRDKDGNVLNDAWILRATTAQITYTNQTNWDALYGNGVLGSGVGTNGRGVTVEFLDQCAEAAPSGSTGPDSSGQSPGSDNGTITQAYTSGIVHKALAVCSVIVIMAAVTLMRTATPIGQVGKKDTSHWLIISVALIAWALGVVGFATSFTSTQINPENLKGLARRDGPASIGLVTTGHAIVGWILFGLVYIVSPTIILGNRWMRRRGSSSTQLGSHTTSDAGEKEMQPRAAATPSPHEAVTKPNNVRSPSHRTQQSIQTIHTAPEIEAHRTSAGEDIHDDEPVGAGRRVRLSQRRLSAPSAFFKEQLWPGKSWSDQTKKRERVSSHPTPSSPPSIHNAQVASTSVSPDPPPETSGGGGFVVLNRGKNALDRRTPPPMVYDQHQRRQPMALGDVSWLERRRNVHLINDLDYAMSQQHSQVHQYVSPAVTPSTQYTKPFLSSPWEADAELASMPGDASYRAAKFPSSRIVMLRCSFHVLLLALFIFTAMSIFQKGDGLATPLGAAFVALAAIFYLFIIVLAIRGKPEGSVTAVIFTRLRGNGGTRRPSRGKKVEHSSPAMQEERAPTGDQYFAMDTNTASTTRASRAFIQQTQYSGEVLESGADAEDDDAEDIEREMGRRDVSIVTVPKRRLYIANSDTA